MKVNQSRVDAHKSQYLHALGMGELTRNERGFIQLTPTAKRVDQQVDSLTTDIQSLEDKLNKYRAEKAKAEKYQKTEEYQDSKKKEKDKKHKKKKQALLNMVFNNADHQEEEQDEEDEENYRDSKRKKKEKDTTLDTTYGKRFSPVVSMLHDTIHEFDKIASDIQAELDSPQLRSKSMYRSNQIGNLISAKNSKLSAVKELASVATTISNLEYKKDKDKKAEEGSDTSKAISSLGARFLRGGFELEDGKSGKSSKGKKGKMKWKGKSDDSDDSVGTIKKAAVSSDSDDREDDRELASQLAKALGKHKDITFSPAERFMKMDGAYNVVVVADSDNPEKDWKFAATDPKTGKIISDFKDNFPGLLPKKKNARMTFDLNRGKAYDKESCRTYKLMLK